MTFHLTPRQVWEERPNEDYRPEAFSQDGFIHCTNGEVELLRVANAFYRSDRREQIVLVLDLARVRPPVTYEDPGAIYPHIYGSLNRDAVVGIRPVERAADGTYLAIGSGDAPCSTR
jgi:uncharacterized protein (DUF952 family)